MKTLLKALKTVTSGIKPLSGLALYESETTIILYNVPEEPHNLEKVAEAIVGTMELRWNETVGSWEVRSIWAKKGYGPTLYLLAMEVADDEGLIPNRSQVSSSASRVWKEFYQGSGKNLVTSESIDGHHKEEWLNRKYFTKTTINTLQATKLNDNYLKDDKYQEKETILVEASDALLRSEMQKIYK